jgi:hypothetical protein
LKVCRGVNQAEGYSVVFPSAEEGCECGQESTVGVNGALVISLLQVELAKQFIACHGLKDVRYPWDIKGKLDCVLVQVPVVDAESILPFL